MRRFHQPTEIVVGYDETTFPKEAVASLREAWRAVAPSRTMPFLRADPDAPAALLVTFGAFPDEEAMRSFFGAVAGDAWEAARRALVDLFRAARRTPVEFQFRYDWDRLIVRGRFHPRSPTDVDHALRALATLAEQIHADRRAGALPTGAALVTARFDGGWRRHEAHGYDPARGRPVHMLWRGAWERADTNAS